MKRWWISDTHFGHDSIRRHCQRPFADCREMHEFMIDKWNSRVQPGDLVIHGGDFASPRDSSPYPILGSLNGNIILIAGNHDKIQLLQAFPTWVRSMSVRVGSFYCLVNHRPIYPESMQNDTDDHYHDHDGSVPRIRDYDFFLTGHIHNNYELDPADGTTKVGRLWSGRSLNLSTEVHHYAPVSEEELVAMLEERRRQFDRLGEEENIIVRADKWKGFLDQK